MPITPPTPPAALAASISPTQTRSARARTAARGRTTLAWTAPVALAAMLFVPSHAGATVHKKTRSLKRTSFIGRPGIQTASVKASVSTVTTGIVGASRSASKPVGRAASVPGTVLFDGTSVSSWWLNQSAAASRVQMVPDPDGAANTAQQFTTLNTDVAPLTPTTNPRSQLTTPMGVLKPGNTYWESFEVYIPQSFTFLETGWVGLETAVYGYPYNGTPPLGLSLESGTFRFQRNGHAPNPWQIAWTTPAVKGQWYRFTWHFLFSAAGWVELYVNDVQQNLTQGKTLYKRLPINLLDASDSTGPWMSDEQLYYQLGMFPSASIYFKNYKIATTQLAAES